MKTEDLVVGDVYVYDGYECVKVLALYKDQTLVKDLRSGEEFVSYSASLMTLEEADHELFLRIKQAETLRQEVKAQLYLKTCQS